MFAFIKNMFCSTEKRERDDLEARKAAAVRQDNEVRESMTQKDYDHNVKETMAGSDPISKY